MDFISKWAFNDPIAPWRHAEYICNALVDALKAYRTKTDAETKLILAQTKLINISVNNNNANASIHL